MMINKAINIIKNGWFFQVVFLIVLNAIAIHLSIPKTINVHIENEDVRIAGSISASIDGSVDTIVSTGLSPIDIEIKNNNP